MSIELCKSKLPLPALAVKLGIRGAEEIAAAASAGRAAKMKSPFRDESNASFSVWVREGKWRWKDHGSGDSGDEVTMIEQAKGCSTKEAIRIYHDLAGVDAGAKGQGKDPGAAPPEKKARAPRAAKKKDAQEDAPALPEVASPAHLRKLGPIVRVYDYRAPDGTLAHQTLRFGAEGFEKNFRQRRPLGPEEDPPEGKFVEDGWLYSLDGIEVFPYRLPELLAAPAEQIWIAEGEKDAEALGELGLLATTMPMGGGKWWPGFERWFKGRRCVICEDYDPMKGPPGKKFRPGEVAGKKLAGFLLAAGADVRYVRMPALWKSIPEGSDVFDVVAAAKRVGMPDKKVVEMLERAADDAMPSDDVWFGKVVQEGPRGGREIAQYELASRLVARRRLLYSGGDWWCYQGVDGASRGRYVRLPTQLETEAWIMDSIRGMKAEDLIDARTVASVEKLARHMRYAHPDDFNRVSGPIVNVRSGMLDLLSGELRPHKDEYLSTVQLPVDWRPNAVCPRFQEWLAEMQPDSEVREQIQEIFGYCLNTSINFHKFFFFYGDGGTGKSTCVDVLTDLIGGENALPLQLQELDNPFTRGQLVGKQLYLCKELDRGSFKHIGLIKAITSGDPIYVDIKNKPGFSFRPQGRFVMESNVVAKTPDASAGFERRFLQITWDQQVPESKRDYGLHEKLVAEREGIMVWAVEGFRRLHARGRFVHTAKSAEATAELLRHLDQIGSFLGDAEWVQDDGENQTYYVGMDELFELWNEWCETHAVKPFTPERAFFSKEVRKKRPAWDAAGRFKRKFDEIGAKKSVVMGLRLVPRD